MERLTIYNMAKDTVKCIERDSDSELSDRQKRVIEYWIARCMEDAVNSTVYRAAQRLDNLQNEIKNMVVRVTV